MKRSIAALLWLLLLVGSADAASYSYGFTTTENPLSESGHWSGGYTSFGDMLTTGGRARVAGSNADERMTVNSISPTNNQYAQFTIPTWAANIDFFAAVLLLRWAAPPTATGLEVAIVHYTDIDRVYIFEMAAGVETQIGDATDITVTPGDSFTAIITGNTLIVYQNSTALVEAVVGGPAGGRIGLGGYTVDLVDDFELDDFIGGDYPITPAAATKHRPIVMQ